MKRKSKTRPIFSLSSGKLIILLVDRKEEEMIKQSECCSKVLRFYLLGFLITEWLRVKGASGNLALSRVS